MNYKSIIDVETIASASGATNVLVEENGSLKKIAGSKIGGGNNKVILAWYEKDEDYNIVNFGSNTNYTELLELYNSHTPFAAHCLSYRPKIEGEDMYVYNIDLYSMRIPYDLSSVILGFKETEFTFHSDDTLTVFEGGNA